jgi:hypothetical protein
MIAANFSQIVQHKKKQKNFNKFILLKRLDIC